MHSPLNQDSTGRNSNGTKFNPTPAYFLEQGNGRKRAFQQTYMYVNTKYVIQGAILEYFIKYMGFCVACEA